MVVDYTSRDLVPALKEDRPWLIKGYIRKKSVTYIGYIDLYRSIGPLGNPLIYRSS